MMSRINSLLKQKVPMKIFNSNITTPCVVKIDKKHFKSLTNRMSLDDTYLVSRIDKLWFCVYIVNSNNASEQIPLHNEAECEILEDQSMADAYAKNNLTEPYVGTIGADPEIFVADKFTGEVVPAFSFLSPKQTPVKSMIGSYANTVYWDGYQAEFTIQANACLAYALDSVQNGLRTVLTEALKHNKNSILLAQPTIEVSPDDLAKQKDEHVNFGCTPSLNIYNMFGQVGEGRTTQLRPAGGHIHFGWGSNGSINRLHKDTELTERIVKALDAICGVACVSMFANIDDPRRRQMYGLAGEYRLPSHGLEYRTLSNAWLYHPLLANLVIDLARAAFMVGVNNTLRFFKFDQNEVVRVINTHDVVRAREIMEENKEMLCQIMGKMARINALNSMSEGSTIFSVFMNGAENLVTNYKDISGNWSFDNTVSRWVTHCDGVGKNWLTSKIPVSEKKRVS